MCFRVVDLTCVCATMKAASEGPLKGILGYTKDKIVSSDVLGDWMLFIMDGCYSYQRYNFILYFFFY